MQKKCPKCENYRVTSLTGICLGIMGLGFIIGLLGLILFPLLFVAGIFLVLGIFGIVSQIILVICEKPTQHICLNCNYIWDE